MPSKLLEKYIEDPKVLYIYEIGLQIYGLFEGVEDRDFLIVVDDDYPSIENKVESGYNFSFIKVKDWFECVLNNDIIAWECACLPKKYILKEHVKLLLQTDPLKLRKQYDKKEKEILQKVRVLCDEGNTLTAQKELFNLIKYLTFANQIIENHKIVNFKQISNVYRQMVDGTISKFEDIIQRYNSLNCNPSITFKEYTDSILRTSKIKKILQKNE